jgi:RimJ/RimL family protein N-acetyltransferase
MLCELQADQYGSVRQLYAPLWYHLAIFSALEGHTAARVVVDDAVHPTVAMLWDKVEGGYYLVGDPDNTAFSRALNRFILEEIYPRAQAEGKNADLVVNYAPLAWERTLGDVLAGIHTMRHARQHFLCREPGIADWRARVPEDMEMITVDADFLQHTELGNMEDVAQWVRGSWGVEDFLARGVGQCLVHGDTIASWCIGDYAAGRECEIGIHTDEAYRRRGLATLTVHATLEQCLARGYTRIGWHCWSNNDASAATALRAGFHQTVEHPVYHAWYNTIDNELVQARMYLVGPEGNTMQRADYDAAAAAYRQAFALIAADPALAARTKIWSHQAWRPYLYQNAARAHLHIGDLHAAQRYLEQATEAGLPPGQAHVVLQDEGLACWHDSAAWQDLATFVGQSSSALA